MVKLEPTDTAAQSPGVVKVVAADAAATDQPPGVVKVEPDGAAAQSNGLMKVDWR